MTSVHESTNMALGTIGIFAIDSAGGSGGA